MRCRPLSRGFWFGFLLTLITCPANNMPSATASQFPTGVIARQNQQPSALSQLKDLFGPRRRSGGTRGGVCLITPGYRTSTLWSDRPLFVWKVTGNKPVERIEIRIADSNTPVWSQVISPTTNQIIYQGRALQPNQTYEVILYDATGEPLTQDADLHPRFTLMDEDQRQQIQQDLASNTKQLEPQTDAGASQFSEGVIAVEKAVYLSQQELWSDALQVLYSVPERSSELQQLIEAATTEACG